METAGGFWRLFREPSPDGQVVAVYQPVSADTVDAAPQGHLRGSTWQVEEKLGFPLPGDVHGALEEGGAAASLDWLGPGERPLVSAGPPPGDPAMTVPRRYHLVHTPHADPQTYGRLLHASSPWRSWENGRFRLDILDTTVDGGPSGTFTLHASYRIWVDGRVLFAGDDLDVTSTDPTSDDALRRLAQQPLTVDRVARGYTARQIEYLQHDAADLAAALTPATAPYPVGTRIRAHGMQDGPSALGTVVTTVRNTAGQLCYLWRPDVYDLPGHPYQQRHIDHTLISPHHLVEPTLEGPDTAVDGSAGAVILTYGGRIRTIDHPHVDTGTVLRAIVGKDDVVYDVVPDGATITVQIPAKDVEPITGTAWPTIQSILAARAALTIPLANEEIIVALRELTTTTRTPQGPVVDTPARPLHSFDVTLDPYSPEAPPPTFDLFRPDSASRPAFVVDNGDPVRIMDSTHGFLDVDKRMLEAALQRPTADLTARLAGHPNITLDGSESHLTIAALAATYLPDLTTTADGPGPPPSPAADPDPPFDLDL